MREDTTVGVAFVSLAAFVMMLIIVLNGNFDGGIGVRGLVTGKYKVDDFFDEDGGFHSGRSCVTLNYREDVCIPQDAWEKVNVGDMYGVKK